jgi:hypothetical protein
MTTGLLVLAAMAGALAILGLGCLIADRLARRR